MRLDKGTWGVEWDKTLAKRIVGKSRDGMTL